MGTAREPGRGTVSRIAELVEQSLHDFEHALCAEPIARRYPSVSRLCGRGTLLGNRVYEDVLRFLDRLGRLT